jgi:hypothetical protein
MSSFLGIIAILCTIGVKDTQILKRLPIDFTETKQQKHPELRFTDTAHSRTDGASVQWQADSVNTSAEPYKNRWQKRFSNNTGSYFFFKHIRKAGGTTLRSYFKDVFTYHGIKHITRDDYSKIRKGRAAPDVLYVEHEFQTMDSDCAKVDGRWDKSLKVITLRVSSRVDLIWLTVILLSCNALFSNVKAPNRKAHVRVLLQWPWDQIPYRQNSALHK